MRKIDRENERLHQPEACPNDIYQILLQCWAKVPTDRPTFDGLKDFLMETAPPVVKVIREFGEENRLNIEVGDTVVVIDGLSENHWWRGQNQVGPLTQFFPVPFLCKMTPGRETLFSSIPPSNSHVSVSDP